MKATNKLVFAQYLNLFTDVLASKDESSFYKAFEELEMLFDDKLKECLSQEN